MLTTIPARPSSRTLLVILSASGLCALLLIVVVFIASRPAARPGPDPGPAPLGPPVHQVTAVQLFQAYHENPLAAADQYTGKVLEVSGIADHITPEGIGFVVFTLGPRRPGTLDQMPERERRWFREGLPASVLAQMDPAERQTFAELKRNEKVVIVGRCLGTRPDPEAWRGMVVVLEQCQLKEHAPLPQGPPIRP